MNSLTGNAAQRGPSAASSSVSLNSYQFDFDLGLSGRGGASSRPLKDQKPNPNPNPNPSSSYPRPAAPSWSPQPNKPSWTHQPAPRSGVTTAPTSMVGDIFGKSWGAAAPAPTPAAPSASTARLGIPDKNPNLFGDLVGSALGQSKPGGNVPLKAAAPRNSYSMGSLSESLPQTTAPAAAAGGGSNPMKSRGNSADNLMNFAPADQSGVKIGGGQPMKSMSGAAGVQMNAKKDPFGSLLDFSAKPSATPPPPPAARSGFSGVAGGADYSFGDFHSAKPDGHPAQSFPPPPPAQQQHAQPKGGSGTDPLDMFFSSSASAAPASGAPPAAASAFNDWDVGMEFGGDDSGGGGEMTTELEGLPPPPAGVTASTAKGKGLDNYKQGQFADAIKWLTWAVVLSEKSRDSSMTMEILSCRASCYKEVGEYKKAVADCSKVLEQDSTNVSVLLQRALLYESTEKYRLGADDLRTVLKIDPGNRLARSTIHRLNKMAD